MMTSIETIRSVARRAADKPPAPRAVPDRPPVSLAGLPPRAARMLARLFFDQIPSGETGILARALAAYLPLFSLDWLPADPRAIPAPTARVEARIDLLRQERTSRARLRRVRRSPPHRVRPDRPPELRAVSALGVETPAEPDVLWHELLDLTSETLETFIGYGHQQGIARCAELLDLLAGIFDVDRPEAA